MKDIKNIHILIFIVITVLLYHFMNSGCSCGKLGGVVEGLLDDSTVYCGGRQPVSDWINDTDCESLSAVCGAGGTGCFDCNSVYDQNGFLCAPPITGKDAYDGGLCTYTPLKLQGEKGPGMVKNKNWGDPDNPHKPRATSDYSELAGGPGLDLTPWIKATMGSGLLPRPPSLGGFYARCETWPKPQ